MASTRTISVVLILLIACSTLLTRISTNKNYRVIYKRGDGKVFKGIKTDSGWVAPPEFYH